MRVGVPTLTITGTGFKARPQLRGDDVCGAWAGYGFQGSRVWGFKRWGVGVLIGARKPTHSSDVASFAVPGQRTRVARVYEVRGKMLTNVKPICCFIPPAKLTNGHELLVELHLDRRHRLDGSYVPAHKRGDTEGAWRRSTTVCACAS